MKKSVKKFTEWSVKQGKMLGSDIMLKSILAQLI